MNKNSNLYIFLYTTICVVIVVVLLTIASVGLQPLQKANRDREMMGQILTASGCHCEKENIIDYFNAHVGMIEIEDSVQHKYQIYRVLTPEKDTLYVIRLDGKGLWGKIWGYMAIESDGNHIRGAVFDHKSETPGLGGEISTSHFSDGFKGKLIFDENNSYVGISVVKGGVANSVVNPDHGVDAITGGTITSKGVEEMLHTSLLPYISYFEKMHK